VNGTEAWQKITGNSKLTKVGRVGLIPVYDGTEFLLFRNTNIIWPGVENVAEPEKVERLRRNAVALLEAFPETIPQLEKLKIMVKATLNKPIKTPKDVEVWANSIFNTGPITNLPMHVEDAQALAYDDFHLQVRGGRHPVWVLPAGPRDSGVVATLDYSTPGSRVRYGPRHEFTKTAMSQQLPRATRSPTEASVRPRGRPRKDGLMPGSKEARAADKAKQRALERERQKKLRARERAALRRKTTRRPARKMATITELPARRTLIRVGQAAGAESS
jgi:hypothetical protein